MLERSGNALFISDVLFIAQTHVSDLVATSAGIRPFFVLPCVSHSFTIVEFHAPCSVPLETCLSSGPSSVSINLAELEPIQ